MQHHPKNPTLSRKLSPRHLVLLGLAASVLSLAACSKQEEQPTAGQQVDNTTAQAEQQAAQAKAEMERTAKDAQDGMAQATDSMANTMKDAAITTAIKAELAKDSGLSALDINVDTEAGKVVLKGTAPDAAARDRAYSLASAVDGVVAVDNELVIAPS